MLNKNNGSQEINPTGLQQLKYFKLKDPDISAEQKPPNKMLNKNFGKFLTKSVPDFKLSFARFNGSGVGSSDQAGSLKQGEKRTDQEDEEDWSQLEKAVLDEKDYDEEADNDFL